MSLASCWGFTGILGCFVGGIISDMFGRKRVNLVATIPFLIATIMLACSQSLEVVLLSRCIAGLGDGIMYPNMLGRVFQSERQIALLAIALNSKNIAVYIAETSSKDLRGTLNNVLNICFCLGLVLTYSVSMILTWRQMAWFFTLPVILTVLSFCIVPETPLWLAEKERLDDALKALAWLR